MKILTHHTVVGNRVTRSNIDVTIEHETGDVDTYSWSSEPGERGTFSQTLASLQEIQAKDCSSWAKSGNVEGLFHIS